ncbi:MAG: 2-(1,2-epoxy-1,2-dihydrophenyl)acetyl-CoA isomerase PaaG [Burkholderiaceae bacterium]
MPDILLNRDGAVATITLNRPDKLNSFTRAMHEQLRAALDSIEADRAVRALVLTGAGRGFCAGQDLADLSFEPGAMTDLGALIEQNFNPLVRRIQALPIPVVASVRGVAAGAGANLALACDIVLAERSASFVQAFAKIGLVLDSGGSWLLPQRIGMARAMGLALLADKLPAERAEQWGLIWKCVDDAALATETAQLAQHLAAQPTKALGMIKAALRAAVNNDLDVQLDLERDMQRELGQSHDYAEGVNAFLQKRAPRFQGH